MSYKTIQRCATIAAIFFTLRLAGAQAAEPGLVGHWKLEGDRRDYSGHGNDGINHGVQLDSGAFDGTQACRYDGEFQWTSLKRFYAPAGWQPGPPGKMSKKDVNEASRVTSTSRRDHSPHVIPAQAGIRKSSLNRLDSRLRGNDEEVIRSAEIYSTATWHRMYVRRWPDGKRLAFVRWTGRVCEFNDEYRI